MLILNNKTILNRYFVCSNLKHHEQTELLITNITNI